MKTITTILALLLSFNLLAQGQIITGNVKDPDGDPAIGAAVQEVGTNNNAIVDVDGKYTITLTKPNGSSLSFNYLGYQTIDVPVGKKTSINVVFEQSTENLEEIVITGYSGTQLRTKVTTSIAKVDKKNLEIGLFSNPAQALSGAVAGLKVVQSSGNPGAAPSIILRGGTNMDGSGSPLVVVDGQIRSGMQDINPEDIESMDVLKDAGATAIYGARASNGVILITTKNGKKGKAKITFKAKVGLNYMNNPYEFVGARDYIHYQRTAVYNSVNLTEDKDGEIKGYGPKGNLDGHTPYGLGNIYGKSPWSTMLLSDENEWLLGKGWQTMADPLDPNKTIIFKDTDPSKTNFNNPALSQDYNVNMSGGNDRGAYYAGLGYNHSEGLPIKSFYKRYNFTFNGDYKISDWLKSESKFNFTKAEWQSMPGSNGSEGNYFGRILSLPPTVRYHDEDGNALLGPNVSDGNQNYQPDKWQIDNESEKFSMTQYLQVDFMKGFYLRASMNWYFNEQVSESFTKDYENTPGNFVTSRNSSASFSRTFDQTYNAVLNFRRTFAEKHNLSVLAGTEFFDSYYRSISASGSGAPTDDFGQLGLTSSDKNMRGIGSSHQKTRILSFFGNLTYDYDDKYLFSAVFRNDGYSSLHKDNRWGFFPGVSAGWIFSKEGFMETLNEKTKLSHAKIRMSYGINGNASGIGPYLVQGSYNTTNYDGEVGYLIGSLPLPFLRWERTKTIEAGLELNFLNNRVRSAFTFYNRLTSDKLANVSFPTSTGFSQSLTNNGEFQNRGVEMEIAGDIIRNKNWVLTASANMSYNKNTVKKLPNNGLERNRQEAVQVYTGKQLSDGSYEKKWVGGYQEGMEPNMMYLYKSDGIYSSYDEIPDNLIVETNGANGQTLHGPASWAALSAAEQDANKNFPIQPGDVRWHDVNGDGKIDQFDKVEVGNRNPHWTGGFNTQLSWKGLSLYVRMDYALGYSIYDNTLPWFLGNMQGTYGMTTDVYNTWTPENTGAKYPRYMWADQLGKANYNMASTMFSHKGNYLAFREISLSYQLPKAVVNKMKMDAMSISITGQNLGYWTSANVASPEVTSAGSGYALPRTLLFGLNLTF